MPLAPLESPTQQALRQRRDAYFEGGHAHIEQRPARSIVLLDATHVASLDAFFCALGDAVQGPGGYFGLSLRTLDDCLLGGFGITPPWSLHVRGLSQLPGLLDASALAAWARARIEACDYLDDDGLAWLEATQRNAESGTRTMWDELRACFEAHGVTVRDVD